MKILIACEESQIVCKAFRDKGHEAYSCDVIKASGDRPEWHIQADVLEVIDNTWDMMVAFPPCTHLAVSGARWFPEKRKDGSQKEGIDFFMSIINAPIKRIAVENPIGIMSNLYRKPDQIIQPYYFGDTSRKSTCLWLKNLQPLFHVKEPDLFNDITTHVEPDLYVCKNGKTFSRDYMVSLKAGDQRGQLRSKTYPGIANAMAEQWG